jgi:anti-anti-sigma regulatory factor
LENLHYEQLKITFEEDEADANQLTMVWAGKSDNRNPAALLNPYFDKIIETINQQRLVITFDGLDLMNSATVPAIIYLVSQLDKHQIKTEVVYDQTRRWQHLSFSALAILIEQMPNITIRGK